MMADKNNSEAGTDPSHNQVANSVVKTMWAIHPGEVRAKDGDIHFINYEQLIRLYGVHPTMCVRARDGWDRTYSPEFRQQFIHLYPREDGKYQVNGLVNLGPDGLLKSLKSAIKPNKQSSGEQP
jgi:hypothetical protein